jgi:uncharacterized membrane protein YjjP (DUF1212 family)
MVDHDAYKTLDLALRVGEMLLANGAGAADVSATMLAVTRACGLYGVSVDVTFTELTLVHQPSFDDPGLVQKRSVRHREIDYEDLTFVDHIVRAVLAGEVTRDDARARMARLNAAGHRRPPWAVTLGWGVMGAGTAVLLGGGPLVSALAFVAAIGIDRVHRLMSARQLPAFYQQVAGGLVASLLAVAAVAVGLPVTPAEVITTGIIMLLAGLGLVGAAQDALTGFPVTANARILEATLATVGIIAGVSGGLTIGAALGVDLTSLRPVGPSLSDLPLVVTGAAVSAAAFAFASYSPKRALLPIALVAAVGTAVASVVGALDLGRTWAVAMAAVAIGVVSFSAAGRIRVPPLVVVVSAVVPLLPGLAIYRGLYNLADGNGGSIQIVTAVVTAVALASGVILGQYLAQPLRREARRFESRLTGPRLVGPLRVRPSAVRRLVKNEAHD